MYWGAAEKSDFVNQNRLSFSVSKKWVKNGGWWNGSKQIAMPKLKSNSFDKKYSNSQLSDTTENIY